MLVYRVWVTEARILILRFPSDSIVPLAQVQSPSLSPPTSPLLASCRCCLLQKDRERGREKESPITQVSMLQTPPTYQHFAILVGHETQTSFHLPRIIINIVLKSRALLLSSLSTFPLFLQLQRPTRMPYTSMRTQVRESVCVRCEVVPK